MGRQDRDGTSWNFVELLDEHGTALLEPFDNVAIVDDLTPDVDGRTVAIECPFHRGDGPFHPGTERPGPGQEDAPIGDRLAPHLQHLAHLP